MQTKYMYKTGHSAIAIKDGKLYIVGNKYSDYYCGAITIMPGFQIELGRDITDIINALKETRLPVIIKPVNVTDQISHYQVIRMHTGKVDNKVVATLVCKEGKIKLVSFNRMLVQDNQYRRYNQISVLHQLTVPYDLSASMASTRSDQMNKVFQSLLSIKRPIKVVEDVKQCSVYTTDIDLKIRFLFILDTKRNKFVLTSISLQD